MKIHLDTDLGGDIDDLCALALLLARPDVEITGITTVGEEGGRRRGYVEYVLKLAGRADIPVAAGADVADGYFRWPMGYYDDAAYWPEPVARKPNPLEDALGLLRHSVEQGATIVPSGPYTNLSLLERHWPGILTGVPLYLMGFYVNPVPAGYPQWDIDTDWNVQSDVAAASYLLEARAPTLIPCDVTLQTSLRRAYLPGLFQAGPIGALIARQAKAFAVDEGYEEKYGRVCASLPDDTINFLHDPLACAVALGWEGVRIETIPLRARIEASRFLRAVEAHDGKLTRVVTAVDGPGFGDWWYRTLTGGGQG
jgi:inosine-uridine nucleoside N-ribohydrolase